jgi:lipopolysaccharide transport protein LptA
MSHHFLVSSCQRRLASSLMRCGLWPATVGLDASLRWHDNNKYGWQRISSVENNMLAWICKRLMAGIITLCALTTHAIPPEPITLQADNKSDINLTTGISKFHGHVVLIQGKSRVDADHLEIRTNAKRQIISARAIGSESVPARLQTVLDNKPEVIIATATEITVFPEKSEIRLQGHAKLQQGTNHFTSPIITINRNTQHILAEGTKNEPTVIRIQESQLRGTL